MVCIYCQNTTKTSISRSSKHRPATWRRLTCINCRAVFTTRESPDYSLAIGVKRTKRIEPLERDKILISVFGSLKHRTSALHDSIGLTDTILQQIIANSSKGVITHLEIRDIILKTLELFDKVAATHYEAFHP